MEEILKKLERAVDESVAAQIGPLKDAITKTVLDLLRPELERLESELAEAKKRSAKAPEPPPGGGPTDLLNAAVLNIFDAQSQSEILKALLDGITQFAGRTVLFVVKSGNLSGWQGRGFDDDSAIKGMALSGSSGTAGRAISDKEPVSAAAAEFDQAFVDSYGNPVVGNGTVLPLVVREKVPAVVYVDAGTTAPGKYDQSAVQLLVRSAASWLEMLALRKSGGAVEESKPEAAPVTEAPPPPPPPSPAASAPAEAAPAEPSGLSAEDAELHKKAKRFAKLLVDEIKLYNQAKVTEGRKNKDLYSRLKEDIDKSRSTYEKRYGSTAAGSAKYFEAEVIRILADSDGSAMGAGFP